MVSCFISRLVILVFGTLYPAYASYKAVRTKNVKEYVKWMMYWIVFALFTCAETFTDLFLSFWFPFYYEIKIITVIYLLSPATKGSSILYRKFVHPALIKKEQEIDEYIAKAKEQGYHTMLNLGSKGVTYATSLIMQTAIKSGGGLVSQLRRSYSLSDLGEEQNLRHIKENATDSADGSYSEDPPMRRRILVQSPRKTISSTDQTDLYFPEIEICQRPEEEIKYRQLYSYEKMSSGYSREDAFYYDSHRPKEEHLVRTASLGPSSRVRTRASTKNGLPKRAGLSEGGSSWSALESHESQNETDKHIRFPLFHSATFPLPFPSLQNLVLPENRHMLENPPHNQIFTFINPSQYSQFLHNKTYVEEKSEEVLNDESFRSSGSGVIIEKIFDKSETQTFEEENDSFKLNGPVESGIRHDDKDNRVIGKNDKSVIPKKIAKESLLNSEAENKNSEKIMYNKDSTETGEISSQERSGRYKKKPAPTPPAEEPCFKISPNIEEEESEFFTPNASPKPSQKHSSSFANLQVKKITTDHESDVINYQKNYFSEVTKKSKTKKGDFNLQRKLHIPKMAFSFWHQKGGKEPSVSDSSSVTSVEISVTKSENKNELEYFIPLKDPENENEANIIKDETNCE